MNTSPQIVAIDNFLDDPDARRQLALADKLEFHPALHKGRRGTERQIEDRHQIALLNIIGKTRLTKGYAVFQVCIAGEELVYHADENQFAAVLYLTPDAPVASGTSFFRSKATGARSSMDIGNDSDKAALTFDGKLLDRTAWEEVDRFGNVYNRLLVYDARLIHAATDYFGHSPETGRLFEMLFWDAE